MDIMKPNQSLSYITSATVSGLDEILTAEQPDMVLVHGDTAATLSAALAAFYHRIPLGMWRQGFAPLTSSRPGRRRSTEGRWDTIADLLFAPHI
jgi:UDP-N-acetylglucosamine 2-epimerase (non-hydrolysing)